MKKPTEQEYLRAAAGAVETQAEENPDIGIPVDPDVAEFMGAFEEEAVSLDDILETSLPDDEE